MGAIRGVLDMFGNVNKQSDGAAEQSPIPQSEYESAKGDKEILELIAQRKREYGVYYAPVEQSQNLAFGYWLGKHKPDESETLGERKNLIDNLIFEAVETFLPIATRANPDPLVTADPSDAGQQLAHDIKAALVDWADTEKLRRKLARTTRNWTWGRIGVLKVYWDPITKAIKVDNVNPKRMMFDKDGYIDEGGHFVGEWEAEKKRMAASRLIEMFPNSKEAIVKKCKGRMGTKLDYIEWWDKGRDLYYTLDDDTVLGKFKNPNWNYDAVEVQVDEATNEEIENVTEGKNHLKAPTSPYRYLSIFSTGIQPHDETSLILQNIPLQDEVNTTNRQISRNVAGMNNGMVVSGKSFTEDQAAQAASALRKGIAIRVPNGDVREAVQRFPAPALPADVFNHLRDMRGEIKNIFGTSGSTPDSVKSTETVRGKILVNQLDSSRIGGAITEQIEQLADSIYNLVTQFMFVYYDEEHFVTTAGAVAGTELVAIKNTNFLLAKTLSITVKEGSLIPKDPLTQRNEAVDLWSQNAIDPLNFFKKLDFPDPAQATQQLILWQMLQKGQIPPQAYLPTFQMPEVAALGPTAGTGTTAVNEPTGQDIENNTPEPASPDAVAAESRQLLNSIPVK